MSKNPYLRLIGGCDIILCSVVTYIRPYVGTNYLIKDMHLLLFVAVTTQATNYVLAGHIRPTIITSVRRKLCPFVSMI